MSRFRLQSPLSASEFERRSVQLMAACALGLAGLSGVQVAPPTRHALSVFTPAARQADAPRPVRLGLNVKLLPSRR